MIIPKCITGKEFYICSWEEYLTHTWTGLGDFLEWVKQEFFQLWRVEWENKNPGGILRSTEFYKRIGMCQEMKVNV